MMGMSIFFWGGHKKSVLNTQNKLSICPSTPHPSYILRRFHYKKFPFSSVTFDSKTYINKYEYIYICNIYHIYIYTVYT